MTLTSKTERAGICFQYFGMLLYDRHLEVHMLDAAGADAPSKLLIAAPDIKQGIFAGILLNPSIFAGRRLALWAAFRH